MLQAIGKNIIVKPVQEEKKETVILTIKENKPVFWEVLSVGYEVDHIDIGDFICVHAYGMQEINHNEEKIFVIDSEKVYAKK